MSSQIVLIDNDVILKVSCYSSANETLTLIRSVGNPGILGSATYVLQSRLARSNRIKDKDAVKLRLLDFLGNVEVLEPNDAELYLAAEFEESALIEGLPIDSGESILLAILILRWAPLMFTGDKRAIVACEAMIIIFAGCLGPPGPLVCLEQLMSSLLNLLGSSELQSRVCGEGQIDSAMGSVFSCRSGQASTESIVAGLKSYISDLRSKAPSVLSDGAF